MRNLPTIVKRNIINDVKAVFYAIEIQTDTDTFRFITSDYGGNNPGSNPVVSGDVSSFLDYVSDGTIISLPDITETETFQVPQIKFTTAYKKQWLNTRGQLVDINYANKNYFKNAKVTIRLGFGDDYKFFPPEATNYIINSDNYSDPYDPANIGTWKTTFPRIEQTVETEDNQTVRGLKVPASADLVESNYRYSIYDNNKSGYIAEDVDYFTDDKVRRVHKEIILSNDKNSNDLTITALNNKETVTYNTLRYDDNTDEYGVQFYYNTTYKAKPKYRSKLTAGTGGTSSFTRKLGTVGASANSHYWWAYFDNEGAYGNVNQWYIEFSSVIANVQTDARASNPNTHLPSKLIGTGSSTSTFNNDWVLTSNFASSSAGSKDPYYINTSGFYGYYCNKIDGVWKIYTITPGGLFYHTENAGVGRLPNLYPDSTGLKLSPLCLFINPTILPYIPDSAFNSLVSASYLSNDTSLIPNYVTVAGRASNTVQENYTFTLPNGSKDFLQFTGDVLTKTDHSNQYPVYKDAFKVATLTFDTVNDKWLFTGTDGFTYENAGNVTTAPAGNYTRVGSTEIAVAAYATSTAQDKEITKEVRNVPNGVYDYSFYGSDEFIGGFDLVRKYSFAGVEYDSGLHRMYWYTNHDKPKKYAIYGDNDNGTYTRLSPSIVKTITTRRDRQVLTFSGGNDSVEDRLQFSNHTTAVGDVIFMKFNIISNPDCGLGAGRVRALVSSGTTRYIAVTDDDEGKIQFRAGAERPESTKTVKVADGVSTIKFTIISDKVAKIVINGVEETFTLTSENFTGHIFRNLSFANSGLSKSLNAEWYHFSITNGDGAVQVEYDFQNDKNTNTVQDLSSNNNDGTITTVDSTLTQMWANSREDSFTEDFDTFDASSMEDQIPIISNYIQFSNTNTLSGYNIDKVLMYYEEERKLLPHLKTDNEVIPQVTEALGFNSIVVFDGIIDSFDAVVGDNANYTFSCTSFLSSFNQEQTKYYSNEEQQKRYPLDKGLEYINYTQNALLNISGDGSPKSLPTKKTVYGKYKVPGEIAFAHVSGLNSSNLNLVCILASHEIQSIEQIYINDEPLYVPNTKIVSARWKDGNTNLIVVSENLGSTTQAVDTNLQTEVGSDIWTNDHRLRGIAYVYLKLTSKTTFEESTEQWGNNVPKIEAVIKGKKVIDPRNKTIAYSDNPALVARDFVSSPDSGLNHSTFNNESLNVAANDCDRRYNISGDINEEILYASLFEKDADVTGSLPLSSSANTNLCDQTVGRVFYSAQMRTIAPTYYTVIGFEIVSPPDGIKGIRAIPGYSRYNDFWTGSRGANLMRDGWDMYYQNADYPDDLRENLRDVSGEVRLFPVDDHDLSDVPSQFKTQGFTHEHLGNQFFRISTFRTAVPFGEDFRSAELTLGDEIISFYMMVKNPDDPSGNLPDYESLQIDFLNHDSAGNANAKKVIESGLFQAHKKKTYTGTITTDLTEDGDWTYGDYMGIGYNTYVFAVKGALGYRTNPDGTLYEERSTIGMGKYFFGEYTDNWGLDKCRLVGVNHNVYSWRRVANKAPTKYGNVAGQVADVYMLCNGAGVPVSISALNDIVYKNRKLPIHFDTDDNPYESIAGFPEALGSGKVYVYVGDNDSVGHNVLYLYTKPSFYWKNSYLSDDVPLYQYTSGEFRTYSAKDWLVVHDDINHDLYKLGQIDPVDYYNTANGFNEFDPTFTDASSSVFKNSLGTLYKDFDAIPATYEVNDKKDTHLTRGNFSNYSYAQYQRAKWTTNPNLAEPNSIFCSQSDASYAQQVWSIIGNASISNSQATVTVNGTDTTSGLKQIDVLTIGKTYKLEVEVSAITATTDITFKANRQSFPAASGTTTINFVADSPDFTFSVVRDGSTNSTVTLQKLSVKAVKTLSEPVYMANLCLDSADRPIDNLNKILECMNGRGSYCSGEYYIKSGYLDDPVLTLEKSDFISNINVIPYGDISKPNVISGTYTDSNNDYKINSYPEIRLSNSNPNEKDVYKVVNLDNITSIYQAQRVANKKLEVLNRSYAIKANVHERMLKATVGDTFIISTGEAVVDGLYLLTELGLSAESFGVEITAVKVRLSEDKELVGMKDYQYILNKPYINMPIWLNQMIEPPVISHDSQTFKEDLFVELYYTPHSNIDAYYTLDGSTPTSSSTQYELGDKIQISGSSKTLSAILIHSNSDKSIVVTRYYTFTTQDTTGSDGNSPVSNGQMEPPIIEYDVQNMGTASAYSRLVISTPTSVASSLFPVTLKYTLGPFVDDGAYTSYELEEEETQFFGLSIFDTTFKAYLEKATYDDSRLVRPGEVVQDSSKALGYKEVSLLRKPVLCLNQDSLPALSRKTIQVPFDGNVFYRDNSGGSWGNWINGISVGSYYADENGSGKFHRAGDTIKAGSTFRLTAGSGVSYEFMCISPDGNYKSCITTFLSDGSGQTDWSIYYSLRYDDYDITNLL